MKKMKRIIITTILGLAGGAAAVWMTLGIGASLRQEVILRMLLNFTLMGFAIGVSGLRWHWALHGLFFGLVLGTLEGLASIPAGLPLFIPLVYGMILGVLIELITTKMFTAAVDPLITTTLV